MMYVVLLTYFFFFLYCNLQRALEPIAKMNLCVCLARMPMILKATGFAVACSLFLEQDPELLRRVGLNNNVW